MLDGRRPATYYARILQPAFANRSPVEQPVMSVDTATPIKRALLSVSDKSGLAAFGRFLSERGVELLSPGGPAKAPAAAGVPVVEEVGRDAGRERGWRSCRARGALAH